MIYRIPIRTSDDGRPTAELEKALCAVPNVRSVQIAIDGREAVIEHEEADLKQIDAVIAAADFGPTSASETEGTRVGPG